MTFDVVGDPEPVSVIVEVVTVPLSVETGGETVGSVRDCEYVVVVGKSLVVVVVTARGGR